MYLVERKPGQPDDSWRVIVKDWWFSAPDHSLGLPESALQSYSSQALCLEGRRVSGKSTAGVFKTPADFNVQPR